MNRTKPFARLGMSLVALLSASAAQGQLRIVNWNVAQIQGDDLAIKDVIAKIAADDKPGFAVAPHLIACSEVRAADIAALEALFDGAIPGVTYTRATYTTSGSEDAASGAEALFYRSDTVVEIPAGHKDIATGANRNCDRWEMQLVGYSSDAAKFYVYSAHLKASSGSANEDIRLAGAQAIRNDADALPAATHIIYCGDFNLYSNAEPAYAEFLSAGNGQAFDPLGSGTWAGAVNAIKHSQSPLLVGASGLTGGGMDDRFDFQLSTNEFQDGNGLSLIGGTYRSFGNDGNHYNEAINLGNNTYYPDDVPLSNVIADDLFVASDHVPVIGDYQIPAIMGASLAPNFGKVIQGATFSVNVLLQNIAAGLPVGIDALDFSIVTAGSLIGNGSGTAPLAPAVAIVPFAVNTSTVGFAGGSATVTALSEATQGAVQLLTTNGQVVRASNASFSASADVNATTASATAPSGTAVVALDVAVFNYLFDANQALLDLDTVDGLGGGFALASGLQSGIGSAPATLHFTFDASAVAPGTYVRDVTVNVSDENLPGATSALVTVHLEAVITTVGNPADLDGNGTVNGADLAILLGQWGSAGSADLDHDGTVGGADLAILLGSWS